MSPCFEARVFSFPKDPENASQYEDAYYYDAESGMAAIADGVSSSIFARQWAEILVRAAKGLPEPGDTSSLVNWLREQREAWSRTVDVGDLKWFQKAKLAKGAFSTLLRIRVSPCDASTAHEPRALQLHGIAIGDSCLFHVRNEKLIRAFPIERSDCFQSDPVVLGSIDLNRDEGLRFASFDDLCYPDDLLVLCTDALAECLLRRLETGDRPKWADFWKLSDQQWRDVILAQRDGRQLRIDDTTFMLLQIKVSSREAKRPSSSATAPALLTPILPPLQPDAGTKEPLANPPSLPITARTLSPLPVGPGQRNSDSHPPRSPFSLGSSLRAQRGERAIMTPEVEEMVAALKNEGVSFYQAKVVIDSITELSDDEKREALRQFIPADKPNATSPIPPPAITTARIYQQTAERVCREAASFLVKYKLIVWVIVLGLVMFFSYFALWAIARYLERLIMRI